LAKSGEHRMLFDLRGRRKRVIQVVYAMLALLMGGGLIFFGIGTGSGNGGIANLLGNGGSSSGSGSAIFDEQIQRIQSKLAKDPRDETLVGQLTRARYNAGNIQIQYDPNTGAPTSIPTSATEEFRKSGDAWRRYIKLNPKEPSANVAQLAAKALLYSASTATTAPDFSHSIDTAVQAQAIFARARPSLNSYLTLSQYSFFAGDFEAGDAAAHKAQQEAPKAQQAAVKQAVGQYRTQGKQIEKQIKAASKFNPGAGGKQALESPLGGLSSGGTGTGAPAP
jgi:hypothetical protein